MFQSHILDAEEARIKAVYANREAVVDKRLYSYFNPGSLFIIQDRERQVLTMLKQHGRGVLEGQKILEVGCGSGYWLREFIKWGARPEDISGIDLRPEAITLAKRLSPSSVTLHCESATRLRFPDAAFDLVIQSTVFSSILDQEVKKQVAREMLRVVKPDGALLWYDFFRDNPRNPDVRGIRKGEVRRLFPNCEVIFRQITLGPPLVRLLAPRSWLLCYFLTMLRILNTHYLALIRPRG
jgi:ubiquinone/menaquinone biosynthesis C-methylase UbiE